ncbi:MAG TPA: RibD family protein [Acidobacteriota bacterium]|nr:RibD family protein [Acidobacteriota bacterium]
MSAAGVEEAWISLLKVHGAVRLCAEPIRRCFFRLDTEPSGRTVSLDKPFGSGPRAGPTIAVLLDPSLPVPPAGQADAVLLLDGVIRLRTIRRGGLSAPVRHLLKTYLPYAFGSLHARRLGRAFTVCHFAQTLDGRIATLAGDSRRIGGPANLVHAHRMRALSDGVLIGSRTLRRDRPRLNVRYVEGAQPARLVLGSSPEGLAALTGTPGGDVYLVGGNGHGVPPGVGLVALARTGRFLPTTEVLRELFKRGIFSVYVEGGAVTTSRFLNEGNVDVLQVQVTPMILGSGLSAFRLPPVPDVGSSLRLADPAFTPVDDGMMIVGTLGRDGLAAGRA